MIETLTAIALGLSLSVCSGFRAIVPLALLAFGHRFAPGLVPLGESFDWLTTTPSLFALGAALILEVTCDKVPALDHVVDLVQTPVRTISGALVILAPLVIDTPLWAKAILVIIGGSSALTVHGAKATVRAASTATTGGLANPIISIFEDIFTAVMAVLAIVIPIIVAALALLIIVLMIRRLRRFFKQRRAKAEVPAPDPQT